MSIGPPAWELCLSPSALHRGDACHLETVKQVVVSVGMKRTRSVTRCSTSHIFSEEFNSCTFTKHLFLLNDWMFHHHTYYSILTHEKGNYRTIGWIA
jgi:hypothetical protein